MTVDQFEAFVQQQRPASVPWTPVTDYSFEARKQIEGPHPQLILDVFQPKRLVDVGCGPNHLVRLVNGLAGWTLGYGLDIGDGADYYFDVTTRERVRSFGADLAICREVLEHLTVKQIRQAVTNLCELTSRFVYLTTRFHPNPQSLLDVADSDDLDPTHITLLNQDFLRTLFVLEGFKRRADLEAQMDWQGKKRVLVYGR